MLRNSMAFLRILDAWCLEPQNLVIPHITVLNMLKTNPLYFEVMLLLNEKLIFLLFLISVTVLSDYRKTGRYRSY